MSVFVWDDEKYSVSIEEMDNQHKKLVQIINSIYSASKSAPNKTSNAKLFDEIINYTKAHFEQEERVMENMRYPDLKMHQLIHQDLVKKVYKYREEFDNGVGFFKPEFVNFLKVWLISHIQNIDKKYAAHKKKMAA